MQHVKESARDGQPAANKRLLNKSDKEVSDETDRNLRGEIRKARFWRTVPIVACAFLCGGALPDAFCQTALTPSELTPPPGNVLFLTTHASGTQNYICEPSANNKGTWVFISPQATLFVPGTGQMRRQIATHFLSPVPDATAASPGCTLSQETGTISCPSWQSSIDSSVVWARKLGSVNAGSDASCPNTGAIPCLLLGKVATRSERDGSALLAKTTFIQRLNTQGGAAPVGACTVGDQALVPYAADYSFYAEDHVDQEGGTMPTAPRTDKLR
jgi:hypothetical protein